ncbi:hypothetical protein GS399_14915 [Pedobacter sp. HMF7647]|uniref:Uncharacterized protein n=1 Tax=Hufsiella arboris TaxID=2695275 RepID=A0A7K1YCG0_9SPHI|nr:hypothetical protein [Hufsiella arboris]MXV52267.1 hypothetical protein [Hufsiella arboris]
MILYWILLGIIFLSFVTGLIRFKQHSIAGKILCCLIFSGLINQCIGMYLGDKTLINYHIFFILQYVLATLFFYYSFSRLEIKIFSLVLLIPVCIAGVINSVYFQKAHTYPSNFALISHSLFLLYSLLLYIQMINSPIKLNLFKQSIFWSATAFLVFPVLMLSSIGLYNYFERHKLDETYIYMLFYIANYIFYILLGAALWFDRK